VEVWAIAKGRCEHRPFGVVDHVVPKKDVAYRSRSSVEFIVSHGPLVSQMGNLAMACDERGFWPLWVDELRDAAPKGSSRSVSIAGHGSQISKVEVWTVVCGGGGR
jgi:hypothetical protein